MESALTIAIRKRSIAIIHLLLSNGADIYLCDKSYKEKHSLSHIVSVLYFNPIILVIKSQDISIVEEIVKCEQLNINCLIPCSFFCNGSILHVATFLDNTEQKSIFNFLLKQKGLDLNLCDGTGCSVLMHLVSFFGEDKIPQMMVRNLLKEGAHVNEINKLSGNKTALIYAVKKFHSEMVKILVQAGANVNATEYWQTALNLALASLVRFDTMKDNIYKRNDVIKTLLQAGAELNKEEIKSRKVLFNGEVYKNLDNEVTEILLEVGGETT